MPDDIKDRLTNWVRDAADVAGDAAKRVAEVTTDAADTISEKYGQSPLQEKMDNASVGVRSCNDTWGSDKEGDVMARPLRLEFPGAVYHLSPMQ